MADFSLRSDLQNIFNTLGSVPTGEIPELLAQLEYVRATATLRLTSTPAPTVNDELINAKITAKRLGVSLDYVYRHSDEFPFTKRMGGKVLFSSRGIDSYIQRKGR